MQYCMFVENYQQAHLVNRSSSSCNIIYITTVYFKHNFQEHLGITLGQLRMILYRSDSIYQSLQLPDPPWNFFFSYHIKSFVNKALGHVRRILSHAHICVAATADLETPATFKNICTFIQHQCQACIATGIYDRSQYCNCCILGSLSIALSFCIFSTMVFLNLHCYLIPIRLYVNLFSGFRIDPIVNAYVKRSMFNELIY